MAKTAKEELAKYVQFDYEGTTYTLEFNRRTAGRLEKEMGVNVVELMQGKVSMFDLPSIFRAALMMHHPRMKQSTADDLYEKMGDKESLLAVLVELLAVPVVSLLESPEEGKAISWTRH